MKRVGGGGGHPYTERYIGSPIVSKRGRITGSGNGLIFRDLVHDSSWEYAQSLALSGRTLETVNVKCSSVVLIPRDETLRLEARLGRRTATIRGPTRLSHWLGLSHGLLPR